MNTMYQFGHFRFTDFSETWQKYVNSCAGESFHSEILKIFRWGIAFLQKLIFGNFGGQKLEKVLRPKRSPNNLKAHVVYQIA